MKPKVFVIKENPWLNYTDAERFGDIVFVTDKDYVTIPTSLVNEKIKKAIENHMQTFDPDCDYLLMTGGPVLIGYAFHLVLLKKGYLSLLQWDNFTKQYKLINFRKENCK